MVKPRGGYARIELGLKLVRLSTVICCSGELLSGAIHRSSAVLLTTDTLPFLIVDTFLFLTIYTVVLETLLLLCNYSNMLLLQRPLAIWWGMGNFS